jgi:hypothetical protein
MEKDLSLVLSRILVGRQNAKTYKDLSVETGLSVRVVQNAVEELRVFHEQPICSATDQPAGMYFATSSAELDDWAARQRERARSLLRSSWAIKKTAKKWKLQEDSMRRDDASPGEVTLGL